MHESAMCPGNVDSVHRLRSGIQSTIEEIRVPQYLPDGTLGHALMLRNVSSQDEMWAWIGSGRLGLLGAVAGCAWGVEVACVVPHFCFGLSAAAAVRAHGAAEALKIAGGKWATDDEGVATRELGRPDVQHVEKIMNNEADVLVVREDLYVCTHICVHG